MIPRLTLTAVTTEDEGLVGAAESRVGTTLHGKYTIDSVLGVGGMGVVYAATHRNGKRFAIKLLHPEFSSRRDLRTRFLREGYVANSVDHPGVVSVLDDDIADDGSAFLVMELLDGNTMEALGARPGARMPLREALGITHQLLDVLNAAHGKGIVHRDIKPANIFVLRDGQVKVLDFGLARLRDATTGLNTTRTGEQMGTPAFMAPEQARGEVKSVDPRTDLWAAGATLFTALSGCLVHEGENARQVMVRAATTPARSLGSVMPDAPAPVTELLATALAFEKSARWPSAAAMRDAVAGAHVELFGPLQREHLKLLFDGCSGSIETDATQPSPSLPAVPMLRDSSVVSAPASTSGNERSEPTTLAQADSSRERASGQSRARTIFLVAGAATLLGGAAAVAFVARDFHSANAITPRSSLGPASQSSTQQEVSEPALNVRAIDSALSTSELPSSSVSRRRNQPQSAPVSSNDQPPTTIQRPPSGARATAARGDEHPATGSASHTVAPNTPAPPAVAAGPSMASIVHSESDTVNDTVPANVSSHVQGSRRHRLIDDPVDHQ